MKEYILKRVLLMIPTLLGITIVSFALIQFVPGGPVEEMIAKITQTASERGVATQVLTKSEVDNIRSYYGFDKPAPLRYLLWLKNILTFDFGLSYAYQKPVWDVIVSRFPVSLFFGVTSFILSYAISIPLGLTKAMRHNSPFDIYSSIVIFAGYVVPGYALGILLILIFAGGRFLNIFPIGGLVSDDFESLTFIGQVFDFLHHMILPMICYMIGQFAFLTLLMKNSLLEELNRDYMRTALMKGSTFRIAVQKHAFRNALIPLVTQLGEIFTVMFAGALLIESVFDIDGMGLLVYNSIVSRDYNVVMGIIFISSFLTMIGRLFSDIVYVVVDPRIKL